MNSLIGFGVDEVGAVFFFFFVYILGFFFCIVEGLSAFLACIL